MAAASCFGGDPGFGWSAALQAQTLVPTPWPRMISMLRGLPAWPGFVLCIRQFDRLDVHRFTMLWLDTTKQPAHSASTCMELILAQRQSQHAGQLRWDMFRLAVAPPSRSFLERLGVANCRNSGVLWMCEGICEPVEMPRQKDSKSQQGRSQIGSP